LTWRKITNDASIQPATGVYSDWKELIAERCHYQCVYCAIHEAQFGGIDHYHIDHYRPKGRAEFQHLENIFINLLYACPICNRFKSDDWPGDPDLNSVSYPDPTDVDYSELFDHDGFELVGRYIAAIYVIERLFLNRAQLIMERREEMARSNVNSLIAEVAILTDQVDAADSTFGFGISKEVDSIKNNLLGLEDYRRRIRPYKLAEIRKS
jgi:hypothetical protein